MTRYTDSKTMVGTPISVPTSTRMAFFDNLKVLMMIVVIVHHVGQAYGPIGAWWPVQEPTRAKILAPFNFMSCIMELINGFSVGNSFHRKIEL